MKDIEVTVCSRCVMDASASDIHFDDLGHCNYCTAFLTRLATVLKIPAAVRELNLTNLIRRVKEQGQGKEYDCIVGVSGGIDSSWALLKAVELGLRPLAVHMDNGWDSELAQSNISNLVSRLDVDLYTYVIEWDEYRSLMEAFFDADVIDIELLYDNAMLAVNYEQARSYGLKNIMSGSNTVTEGMLIPTGWNWNKMDVSNIRGIAKQYGDIQLSSYPSFSNWAYYVDRLFRKINWVPFLDYLDYGRAIAISELEEKVNFRSYPYKHYESIFTRFYQGYILPEKFGVDKRRVHLSTLVIAGEMTREQALADLDHKAYPTAKDREADMAYFLKKMKWSTGKMETYMARAPRKHDEFPTDKKIVQSARMVHSLLMRN